MRMKSFLMGAAAASLAAAPVASQAASRAPAPIGGENGLAGEGSWTPFFVLAGIAAVIFVGATLADDDDEPASP